jgi:insertion element IS1 protein InsB
LGFKTGDRSEYTGDRLFKDISKYKAKQYCTDGLLAYKIIIPEEKHVVGKAGTYTIEGLNNVIRHYLARFHRRTHCYSKSVEMMICSLNLLFRKKNFGTILI